MIGDPREQLRIDLINALCAGLPKVSRDDISMKLSIIMSRYEVTERTTEIVPYEGDVNEQMIKRFLAAKIARGCSARTVQFYGRSIPATLRMIGKPYSSITADDVRLYLAKRINIDKVSKTSVNNERRNLSSFYTWLQKEEILLKNPMSKVEAIKETKKKKKAYTLLDLEKIRMGCQTTRERAVVEVLASTWARVSEAAQIRIDEINGDKVIVHGKGDKDREVYLNARAQLAISAFLSERKDSNPYLFPRAAFAGDVKTFRKNRPIAELAEWYKNPAEVDASRHTDASTLEIIVRKIGKRAGVTNVHPHRFRRTGATMALRSGMPLTTVSKLLGHESIATTQIYLDISDEELQQAHSKYVT